MSTTHTLEYYQVSSVIQWCVDNKKQYILYPINMPQVDMIIDKANYQLNYSNTLTARCSKYVEHHIVRGKINTAYHKRGKIKLFIITCGFQSIDPKAINSTDPLTRPRFTSYLLSISLGQHINSISVEWQASGIEGTAKYIKGSSQ